MGAELSSGWNAAAASALDWWREAGVDTLVSDDIRDWLAPPAPVAAPARPVALNGDALAAQLPKELPATLESFRAWRIGADAPEAGWHAALFAATGPADADLMVLTDFPEDDDEAAGTLLSGAAGRLLDRMLAAIGAPRESVHVGAFAAARPLTGKIPAQDMPTLVRLARHHVLLAAPKRVLILGQTASRALLAADHARPEDGLRSVNLSGVTVRAMACLHPRLLLERPAAKAEAWKDLQSLLSGESL